MIDQVIFGLDEISTSLHDICYPEGFSKDDLHFNIEVKTVNKEIYTQLKNIRFAGVEIEDTGGMTIVDFVGFIPCLEDILQERAQEIERDFEYSNPAADRAFYESQLL